jgi:hypothetical protein
VPDQLRLEVAFLAEIEAVIELADATAQADAADPKVFMIIRYDHVVARDASIFHVHRRTSS